MLVLVYQDSKTKRQYKMILYYAVPTCPFQQSAGRNATPVFVQNAIRGVHNFTPSRLNIFTSLPPDN